MTGRAVTIIKVVHAVHGSGLQIKRLCHKEHICKMLDQFTKSTWDTVRQDR